MDRKLFLFLATVVAVVILTGMSKLAILMLSFSVYCMVKSTFMPQVHSFDLYPLSVFAT